MLEEATTFVGKYQKDISLLFAREIVSMRSALTDEIKQVYSVRELAGVLLIENHSLLASFPEVCMAF